MSHRDIIQVHSQFGDYPIDIRDDIGDFFGAPAAAIFTGAFMGERVFITDEHVASLYPAIIQSFKDMGQVILIADLPNEANKTMDTVLDITSKLLEKNIGRDAKLIAMGGGLLLDVVGFLGSIYMRGIEVTYIPTSTTAMIDAAIGGKTAINLAGKKNILGTFKAPKGVFMALNMLQTLEVADYNSGIIEAMKHGLIASPRYYHFLIDNAKAISQRDPEVLKELIIQSIHIKKALVERDELEENDRLKLNFGHSYGHALEMASDYSINHGQGVAMGILLSLLASSVENKEILLLEIMSFYDELEIQKPMIDKTMKIILPMTDKTGTQRELIISRKDFLSYLQGEINDRGQLIEAQIRSVLYPWMIYDKKIKNKEIRWIGLEALGKPTIETIIMEKEIGE